MLFQYEKYKKFQVIWLRLYLLFHLNRRVIVMVMVMVRLCNDNGDGDG